LAPWCRITPQKERSNCSECTGSVDNEIDRKLLKQLAPQAGFGTADAERSEALRFPEDRLRLPTRGASWLAALDDFRNWLIREAA
jgi:hypothetical protein